MTSQERHKKKRKAKRLYITAYSIIVVVILNMIWLFKASGNEATNTQIILLVICGIMLPAFSSLIFGMYAGWAMSAVRSEFTRMFDEKNKRYFRRFYDAVIANDLELARKRFNLIAVRTDTYRVFAHGMLITIMRMSGTEKNVRQAEERMSKIL